MLITTQKVYFYSTLSKKISMIRGKLTKRYGFRRIICSNTLVGFDA